MCGLVVAVSSGLDRSMRCHCRTERPLFFGLHYDQSLLPALRRGGDFLVSSCCDYTSTIRDTSQNTVALRRTWWDDAAWLCDNPAGAPMPNGDQARVCSRKYTTRWVLLGIQLGYNVFAFITATPSRKITTSRTTRFRVQ